MKIGELEIEDDAFIIEQSGRVVLIDKLDYLLSHRFHLFARGVGYSGVYKDYKCDCGFWVRKIEPLKLGVLPVKVKIKSIPSDCPISPKEHDIKNIIK